LLLNSLSGGAASLRARTTAQRQAIGSGVQLTKCLRFGLNWCRMCMLL
jgi:hypothetical protein